MIFDKLFKKDEDSGKTTEAESVSAVDYYAEGKVQLSAGNYTLAMEYFQAVISTQPTNESAYFKLAEAYYEQGKTKEAESTLYKLLSINPGNIPALELLNEVRQPTAFQDYATQQKAKKIKDDLESFKVTNTQQLPFDNTVYSQLSPFTPQMELPDYKTPHADLLSDSEDFKRVLLSDAYQHSAADLPVVIGLDDNGNPVVEDLVKMQHLMVAGMTNYGAPTFLNGMIMAILLKKHPSEVKLVLLGDKRIQLTSWPQLENHFLAVVAGQENGPVIDGIVNALRTLRSLVDEMNARYNLFKSAKVRNFDDYNEAFGQQFLDASLGHRYLPRIVVVFFELHGLLNREIESEICNLTHLGHVVGINIVLQTNQPMILSPQIQSSIHSRLSFKVSRLAESNAILGESGAQHLTQIGEAIYKSLFGLNKHVRCLPISDDDIDRVVGFISRQRGLSTPYKLPKYYFDDEEEPFDWSTKDEFFNDAARLVVASQFGSTSLLQRKLQLGYNRAGRILDQLEAAGIVGPYKGSKARDVLIKDEWFLENLLKTL